MNIYAIAHKTGISLAKLRKLDKLKVLKVDAADDRIPAIRLHLSRNPRLTVDHLMAILEDEYILEALGVYADRARAQIDALGYVAETALPVAARYAITGAAKGSAADLDALMKWVQEVMPSHDVPYHWFAVRLLSALGEKDREEAGAAMNMAFAKLRAMPRMAGWWRKEGTVIAYRRPLDL